MPLYRKAGLAAAALIATMLHAAAQTTPDHMGHGAQSSQQMPPHEGMGGPMHGMLQQMHEQMMQGHGPMGGAMGQHGMMHQEGADRSAPILPGQDPFGAIQEVVKLLDADPNTDWSKIDIGALREHLIDMNEVTLHAAAGERRLANGVEVTVTGEGRVLDAIKRMVPAHARELNGMNAWSATTEDLPNGVSLTVTTSDPKQVPKLQALGLMGLMAQGSHHQAHHLAMARGEFQHH
jgi:hypothetical protein